jgi:hypothetical protein
MRKEASIVVPLTQLHPLLSQNSIRSSNMEVNIRYGNDVGEPSAAHISHVALTQLSRRNYIAIAVDHILVGFLERFQHRLDAFVAAWVGQLSPI